MAFVSTLLVVTAMQRSKNFYRTLLGMDITADYGANVTLNHTLSLQTVASWQNFIEKEETEITFTHHSGELYFEEEHFDEFLQRLADYSQIQYVHPLKEHRWGQRVIRFYDPDGHIIEVGEPLSAVAKRFAQQGLDAKDIALRMDIPYELTLTLLDI